jgi:hypothetical protein
LSCGGLLYKGGEGWRKKGGLMNEGVAGRCIMVGVSWCMKV